MILIYFHEATLLLDNDLILELKSLTFNCSSIRCSFLCHAVSTHFVIQQVHVVIAVNRSIPLGRRGWKKGLFWFLELSTCKDTLYDVIGTAT